MIESIRQAMRQQGKEGGTYRFTQDEKRSLADVVYTYRVRGTRTNANEVTRIGLNFLLADYRENGGFSVLAIILERLHS